MLRTRVITACILLLLFLTAVFLLPVVVWSALIIVVVMQGTLEWMRLAKLSGKAAHVYWWLTLALMLAMVWFDWQHPDGNVSWHLLIYSLSALLWLVVVPVWLLAGWRVHQPWLMAIVGWVVLIPMGVAMMDLRAISPWWLLGVMGLVWIADIGAYFSGRKFGKVLLAPSISPGKTWEGVIGALIGATGYVLMVGFFSGVSVLREMLPLLVMASWWWVALAVMGDLFESAIKRQAGVKDSGALLPGHGGLLDRIDALTSTLPLAAMVLLYLSLP